jgi:TrmH family RNA methyltransferase
MRQIAARANQHFKALKKLCRSGRERRRTGQVLIDGMHLIEVCVQHSVPLQELLVSESGLQRNEIAAFLASTDTSDQLTILSDVLFAELATVETPSGIMAIIRQPHPVQALNHEIDAVLLDGIQDPGNLGSILRSAAAAGFRQVLLAPDCAQPWSPKTLRAGMGAHFQLDLHEGSDLPTFLGAYRGQAVLTALDASVALYSLALSKPVAWVFGSEGQGVRAEVANSTQLRVRIPMPGKSESLNVAAAAAVCLFETVRQRL